MPNSTSASDSPSKDGAKAAPPRYPRPRRRFWRWLGLGLAACCTLLLIAWGLLLTPLGLDLAARVAERGIAAGSGLAARIENVSGTLPFSLNVGRFALADKKGTWLVVADARLSWSPLALLRGRVVINEIAAGTVRVRRAPDLPPSPQPPAMEWPPRFPRLPPILVDRLAVGRLILDKELAGQDAVIRIDGRLAESGAGAVGLALAATRLDGDKPLSVKLAGSLNYADWKLAAKASLADAPGGLLASALAGPDGGGLAVNLTGDGPLDAWKGTLAARLGDKEFLTADLGLGVPLRKDALAAFSVRLTAAPPSGLLPEAAAKLVGDHPDLSLAGRVGIVSDDLFLDALTAHVAAGSLTAKAGLDATGKKMTGTATVLLPDASALDPSLAGNAAVTIDASGPLNRPKLTARLILSGFTAGPTSLKAATINATADPAGDLDGPFPGAGLTVTGNLDGLAGPEGTTLLGDALRLTATADLAADGAVTARAIALEGGGGAVRASDVRYAADKVTGRLAISVADIAGAAGLAGLRLTGKLALAADIAADAAGKGQAALKLDLTGLAPREGADAAAKALAALLGASPTIAAKAGFAASGARIESLTLNGKAVTLAASGDYDAATGGLAAKAALKAPDLAVLERALGEKSGGALTLDLTATGTAAAPRLTVSAKGERLVFGDLALAGLELAATGNDLAAAPTGTVSLAARREGESARFEADYALRDTRLTVSKLHLAAPDAAFSGDAVIDTATGRVSGKLSGKAGSLAGLGRFAGQKLAGSLTLAVTATAGKNGQGVVCDMTAADLRLPGLAAARLTVAANLDDVSGNPRGKADIAAKGLAAGELDLATLSLAGHGDGRTFSATLDAKGTIPGGKPLTLATTIGLAPAGKGRRITVASLGGSLDTKKFRLTGPATVTLDGANTRLDALALTFDKAKIEASASLSPRSVSGKASITHLSLPMLASFGVTGLGGTGQVAISLAGSAAKPELTAEASVNDLSMASEKGSGLPTLAVTAKASVSGGKAEARATVGPTGKKEAVTVVAGLPVRFALSPFAFDVPPHGALSGRITADSDLSQMAGLLAQANTRIVGRLTADMALGGTLAAPSVTGSMALAAKKLENADAGLVLHNLTFRANASGGTIAIEQASGQDGHGGTFTLTGKVDIADPQNGPVDLNLKLNHLRVAGLDLARVTANGSLAVAGTLSRMRASGNIEIGPADINLPTSLPPDVVVIPVTYVNDPNAPKKKAKHHAPPAAARRIDLDITAALGQAVYVRGLGLESRWEGKVKVTGTAAAPVVVGKYYVAKGRVELFGSNLEITKGDVTFTGGTPPAPILDILAENTSGDVTAGVSITGDATNPSIKLVSTPTLPHDEILSRILFGQSARTLSPIQAAQLAQAAASLYAGGTPTSVLARTRRILGLDQLSLVSGKGTGMASTVLKAGKEITKGVTVGVEQGMGAQTGAVSVEVQVTPNITVDSRVGADNKQGVGVNWKWDY
ncbi:MAG: translocation/assembly module TamB domain-containing protein [Desulfovibrio sp.]